MEVGVSDAMKILVQNRRTNEFLTGDARWTPDESAALCFGSSFRALAHCFEYGVGEAQIVVTSDRPNASAAIIPVKLGRASISGGAAAPLRPR